MSAETMRDRILDAAERRARAGGYHAFSFREIAADVGIKSASVHYHFPTKAALGAAMAQRYAKRALEAIGSPTTPMAAFERVVSLFRGALTDDDLMCLCGMFGAERDGLPKEVAASTELYFSRIIGVMRSADPDGAAAMRPETVLSTLEGALLLARARNDPSAFDRVVADLTRLYEA